MNEMINAWEFVYEDTSSIRCTANYEVGSLYVVGKPSGFSNYRFECPKMMTTFHIENGTVAMCVGTGYYKANPKAKHAVFLTTTSEKTDVAIEVVIADREIETWEKRYLFMVDATVSI